LRARETLLRDARAYLQRGDARRGDMR